MKRYLFKYMLNTRDLGGTLTKDGKMIKFNRFIRSDAPTHMLKKDIEKLKEMGFTTTIDLRTPFISSKYPSMLSLDNDFSYFSFPIIEGSLVDKGSEEDTPITYMRMLDHVETFKDIFLTIIKSDGGVFYNCSAGKDRTGILTFLLLDLVGVDRQIILEDYAISESYINKRIPLVRKDFPSFPTTLGFSKKEHLLRFFDLFDSKFKSAENYLTICGLTSRDIQSLIDKLVN